jgi:protein-S-isoprenylcysteine O-methyltransferase Ste14
MSTYTAVLTAIFAASVLAFVTLLFLDAPYGRFLRDGWGVTLSARWAWFIMEFPAALSILVTALAGAGRDPAAFFFLALWQLHYLYRSLVYPFLLPAGGTKSMPVVLIAIAIAYNSANGYVNGYHLFHRPDVYGADWFSDLRFIAGILIFAVGAAIHVSSDRTLQRLRSAGSRRYDIPRGGMFRYVSCPNYLGEIIQWSGFALATWSLAGLSFALFTTANLLPRALSNHRWYRAQFPDYPGDRTAIIPGIL